MDLEPTAPSLSFSEQAPPPYEPPPYFDGAQDPTRAHLLPPNNGGRQNPNFPQYQATNNNDRNGEAPAEQPVNINMIFIGGARGESERPPQPMPRRVRPAADTQSITSETSVIAEERTAHSLRFDAHTYCAVGAFAKGNRLSKTFNQLRKANQNIGYKTHSLFPFGGAGCFGSCTSLFFELFSTMYAVGVPLFLVFLKGVSDAKGGMQVMQNLFMWALFSIQLVFIYIYLIAFQIHNMNKDRFLSCPWIIEADDRSYLLMGKPNSFRETATDEMIRCSKTKTLPVISRMFDSNTPAMAMYYSSKYYRRNVRNVYSSLLIRLLLLVVSNALFVYFGITWGQIVIP